MSDARKQALRRLAPAAIATLNLLASAPVAASALAKAEGPLPEEVRTNRVRAMQAGDRRAFDQLFQSEYRWSYGIARRVLPDREDARDLVAEAWEKVWEESGRLRDARSFRGWAATIITHMAHGHQRARIRQKSVRDTLPLPEPDEEARLSSDPALRDPVAEEVLDRWDREETRKALAAARARLEAGLLDLGRGLSPARAAVYRALLAHLSRGEEIGLQPLRARIAADLGISRNTASMRLLWLFRKATEQAVPLATIAADPELARLARPAFRRVAARLAPAKERPASPATRRA
jgi:RNA polymerase sigma factor (sigma-70 family)